MSKQDISKEKIKRCYEENKKRLQKAAHDQYRELSEEEKKDKNR